jgi:hypothetical protein
MNCRDFEMNVVALARDELIDANRREIILAHTVDCVGCADRLAAERALIAGVRAVVAALAEEKAPAYIGAALLTAFRENTPAVTGSMVIPIPRRTMRHWRLAAAAAMILILASVSTFFWLSSRSSNQTQEQLIALPAPSALPEPASTAANYEPQPPHGPSTSPGQNRVRRLPNKHRVNAAEEVTEFFPLMDGIDLDSLEAVQSVRVELPASALMDIGLRVDPEMPTGPVKADVLLGLDGLARAIRFVR